MPIYEYRCRDCNSNFEEIVTSASSDQKVACNKCSSTNVCKTISASSYRLSGSSGSSSPGGPLGSGCGGTSGFS